ncbi:conserved hypothetical protein [Culex quinquefasciatus]|uniref:Ionotropic glutamate receptor L-glutamate and glycine-binding domain-containing protein n=1 Tax=Culex quinquefasciatus TaxID=7176 RepID=B0XKW3_CULQU|nr:conserved hypothetical protein [Culex quinquefasciatus]|eukprot:XP_001870285.1 conserved hypothetical protein [Culex quinquefasciatus]
MELTRVGIALLLQVSTVIASKHQNVLEYSLRTIEYLIDQHVGRFECVLLDISPQNAYDNILDDLLRAPRLEYMAKYVIQGAFRSPLLPKYPQLLVIHPGREADFIPFVKSIALSNFIHQFSPFTQVLVFMDLSEPLVEYMIRLALIYAKFNHVLFFDTTSSTVALSSLKNCVEAKDDLPHPKYLFKWFKGQLLGSNITYTQEPGGNLLSPSFKWIMSTAEYLKGEALEYYNTEGGSVEADVQLEQNVSYGVQPYFRTFIVTAPLMTRILYGIKFRYNLTANAASVNHSTIGKYLIHGEPVHIWDNEPGVALYVTQSVIELIPKFSYDLERGQTWFVVLDDDVFFDGILIHRTAYRSQYLKAMEFTHVALDEGGILNLWLRQARENLWLEIWGARPRGKAVDEEYLTFGDMMLAWIVLGIGYGVGLVGFVGELARKRFV